MAQKRKKAVRVAMTARRPQRAPKAARGGPVPNALARHARASAKIRGMELTDHCSANARRVALAYRRRKAGRVVLQVEVEETPLVETLIEAKLLDPNVADDRAALSAALTQFIIAVQRRHDFEQHSADENQQMSDQQ